MLVFNWEERDKNWMKFTLKKGIIEIKASEKVKALGI